MVGVGQHLARDSAGRLERELGDLRPDLLQSAPRLGLDLLRRIVEATLPVGLELVAHPLLLGLTDATRLREDLLRVPARLLHHRAVLLEQPPRFGTRVVGLLDCLPDPLAPGVDRLLDRTEDPFPEHEERDPEADQRPDHEAGDDLDERVGGEDRHR